MNLCRPGFLMISYRLPPPKLRLDIETLCRYAYVQALLRRAAFA